MIQQKFEYCCSVKPFGKPEGIYNGTINQTNDITNAWQSKHCIKGDDIFLTRNKEKKYCSLIVLNATFIL